MHWIKDLNEGVKKTKDRTLFFGPVLASDEDRGHSPRELALKVLDLLGMA